MKKIYKTDFGEIIYNGLKNYNTFIETSIPGKLPKWTTENQIVINNKSFILRKFKNKNINQKHKPTIIVPPQAGHSSHIADYDRGQSIVETVLDTRDSDVYCIEWLSCTQERKNESISDLVYQLKTVFDFVGESHLIGLCQGGWLSAIYTSLYQNSIKSLTCMASPIDFHGEGGIIYDMCTNLGIEAYRFFVSLDNGIMSGKNMLLGWKSMNFIDRYIIDYLDIFNSLNDEEKIKKIYKFRCWYENTQDIAGTWYLEAVEKLFIENRLIVGEFQLNKNSEPIDLRDIVCPIVMIAGNKDDITLKSHLFALGEYASSELQYKDVIDSVGHIGVFISKKSQPHIVESINWLVNNLFV